MLALEKQLTPWAQEKPFRPGFFERLLPSIVTSYRDDSFQTFLIVPVKPRRIPQENRGMQRQAAGLLLEATPMPVL